MANKYAMAKNLVRAQGAADAADLAAKTVAGEISVAQLLAHIEVVPEWRARDFSGVPIGTPYQHEGMIYKLRQQHDATGNEGWTPPAVPALWTAVSKPGETGTQDDPITAARGMEYEYGCYYLDPENQQIYLCTRTGEAEGGKIILQYLPHELIGQYFALTEVV